MSRETLLKRLAEIGRAVAATGTAEALIALGSVGVELDRLDAYSDLDLFVIVKDGYETAYRADLGWLSAVCPIAYCFRNTEHGYKLLFEDGIFMEFAVFTLAELAQMEFPEGRIVWKAAGVDDSIRFPRRVPPPHAARAAAWLVGEALTNLYVGLGRFHRGERIAALRFIQSYAVERILELAPEIEVEAAADRDIFALERRFEQRFPTVAKELPRFLQGYARSPESAAAMLSFLERHWDVDPAMKQAIVALLPLPPDPAGSAVTGN